MFSSKEKLLEFVDKHNAYSYKDFKQFTKMSIGSINYYVNTKYKLHLKELKKQKIFNLFDEDKKPKEISSIMNIPLPTIYFYYRMYKDTYNRKKKDITKLKCKKMLINCNFSLNCIYRTYGYSKEKIKRLIKQVGLQEFYLSNRIEPTQRKRKKNELQNKVFEFFKQYPNALNKSGSELAVLFDCSARCANRLKKRYYELYK